MKTTSFAVVLAVVAGSCVTAPGPSEKTPLTVNYVQGHIGALHGQTVRMRGDVNNCYSLTCSICDGPDKDDACLGLDLFADSDDARYVVEELYRFATITIDAVIDAKCEVGYDADTYRSKAEQQAAAAKDGSDVVIICTDRATSVRDARVVSVDARRPASLGRFDGYLGDPLVEATGDHYGRLHAMLERLPWRDKDDDRQLKLYPDPDPFEGSTPDSYYLCNCNKDDCTDRWPTMSGHAYTRSPANPYFCQYVSRTGETWIFSP